MRANVVCPGARTRLSTGSDYEQHIAELNRRGLLDDASMQGALDAAPPEYVAPTYAYLVSDAARRVTGRIFIAAGGVIGARYAAQQTGLGNLLAVDMGGTSFDALYVNVNGQSGYFDRRLDAYGQEGRPCSRCGTPIRRSAFMNRSSFWCPRCQPRPRSRG